MIYPMCAEKNPPSTSAAEHTDTRSSSQDYSLQGKILIAMPEMGDPRFERAVIVVLEHGSEGAMGIVINKPLDAIEFPELLEQLDIPLPEDDSHMHHIIHFGGPVELGRGFVLHSQDVMLGNSLTLNPLAVTTSLEMLALIANGVGPKDLLFCLGYTGWSAGQLENEIKQNAWLHAPLDPAILFNLPHEKRWDAAMALVGVNPDHLSSVSGRA